MFSHWLTNSYSPSDVMGCNCNGAASRPEEDIKRKRNGQGLCTHLLLLSHTCYPGLLKGPQVHMHINARQHCRTRLCGSTIMCYGSCNECIKRLCTTWAPSIQQYWLLGYYIHPDTHWFLVFWPTDTHISLQQPRRKETVQEMPKNHGTQGLRGESWSEDNR